jgi:protein TonB
MFESASTSLRNAALAGSVMVLHIAALWALQTGLLRRAVEIVVPVAVLSEFITPAVPKAEPPPLPKPPDPVKQRQVQKTAPALPPAPMPVAIADATPAPNAPTGIAAPPVALPPIAAPVAEAAAPVAAPPPPKVDLPSSDADYLQNPKPAYPAMSKRLGEQGKVVVRVLIGTDGTAQQVELRQSSGYDRLDQAALATVQRWRYVPGKRGGVAEAMWFNVPIHFVLG